MRLKSVRGSWVPYTFATSVRSTSDGFSRPGNDCNSGAWPTRKLNRIRRCFDEGLDRGTEVFDSRKEDSLIEKTVIYGDIETPAALAVHQSIDPKLLHKSSAFRFMAASTKWQYIAECGVERK